MSAGLIIIKNKTVFYKLNDYLNNPLNSILKKKKNSKESSLIHKLTIVRKFRHEQGSVPYVLQYLGTTGCLFNDELNAPCCS